MQLKQHNTDYLHVTLCYPGV